MDIYIGQKITKLQNGWLFGQVCSLPRQTHRKNILKEKKQILASYRSLARRRIFTDKKFKCNGNLKSSIESTFILLYIDVSFYDFQLLKPPELQNQSENYFLCSADNLTWSWKGDFLGGIGEICFMQLDSFFDRLKLTFVVELITTLIY